MRKRKEKQKGKERRKGEKENKEKKKIKQFVERKEGKRRKKKRERENFLAFGLSKFDSLRTKVGARSALYMWKPKSWSFDNFHEVGYFSTWFTFSLKAL